MSSNESPAEAEGPISKLLTFRGSVGQGGYFLGLIAEIGILLVGVMALAALNNPTGAGGGVVVLAVVFPLIALYLHFCLVTARLRDAGVARPVLLGIFVALLPFIWLGLTFELIERLWLVVLIGFVALYFGPVLSKSKAAQTTQT